MFNKENINNQHNLYLQKEADDFIRFIHEFEEDDFADFLFEDEEVEDNNDYETWNDDSIMNFSGLFLTYSEWVSLFI